MSRPFMRKLNPFKPSDYTGCQLWLDGADPNATGRQPASGTVLTSWTDKSGSGNTVTLPSLTYSVNTFTGYPGVVFTSGTASSQLTLSPYDCFFASSYTSSLFPTSYPGLLGQTAVVMFGNYWQSANFMANGGGFNTNGLNTYGNYVADARNMTVSDVYSLPSSTFALRVGSGDQYPNNSWLGHIYEVIVFSNALNTRQRQQVEGYLCQKWGTVSYLPAGHPGRTAVIYPHNLQLYSLTTGQPTLKPYIRSSRVSLVTLGLLFHLDAGNPTSYPGSGSTWTDLAGSGLTTTLYNSPTYSSANGGYLAFVPGSSQYGQTSASLTSLSVWSVEVWHYYNNTNNGAWPAIVTEVFSNPYVNFALGAMTAATNNVLEVGYHNNGWYTTSTTYTLPSVGWYHIVGTYDGTNLKLYINNVLTQTAASSTASASSSAGIRFMRRWDSGDYWGGYLAIVRIYNRALSATEINTNYQVSKARFGLS